MSNFWTNQIDANKIITEANEIKNIKNELDRLFKLINEKKEEMNLLNDEYDEDLKQIIENELIYLEKEIDTFEIQTLLSGEYDNSNCILEIHSGAGGTESCDWVNMLYRMYIRWCEANEYKYELIDLQQGEEVGFKNVSILVKGSYAYGYLRSEKGVHRLVRISPFDSNKRRHTTFASVEVIPEFDNKIEVDLKEEDLKIDVYRSSGAGGQSVNTTDSAVRITHLPTKIVVTCQNERSQLKNKEKAMQILKNKLYLLDMERKENELSKLRGTHKDINFGSQIRSYVMHPYSMVKDHRTLTETSDVEKVLDGDINKFIEDYLRMWCSNEVQTRN